MRAPPREAVLASHPRKLPQDVHNVVDGATPRSRGTSPDTFGDGLRGGPPATAAHGIADPATARAALDGVYRTVIAPGAAELLA